MTDGRRPTATHLIGAYGLFWQREAVDWMPGGGSSWQMLGRNGSNPPRLQVCDFRKARGFYLLLNDHGVTYVGIARGKQGLGARLRKHHRPPARPPADMKYAPKDWSRFCWFSFDDIGPSNAAGPKDSWREVVAKEHSLDVSVDGAAKELEALMIKVMGVKAQNQMRFARARPWKQVTLQDCQPGGVLTRLADPTRVTTPTLRNALENLAP